MKYCGCLLGAFLTLLLGPAVVAAPPQVTQINPLAVVPGQTVEITFTGQHLQKPQSLWTTFAAHCDFVTADDESSKKGEKLICRVTTGRGEQIGVGAVRVVTSEGVSNPLLVMVDDLISTADIGSNHTLGQAQKIDLPIAIDGQCDAVHEDLFRFHVLAGEQLSFETVSQRLGSKLDPVLRLLTVNGNEIIRIDDSHGSGGDSRFSHSFETAGDYLLAISDVRHQGGAEYRYRLRVGKFPLVTTVFPSGGSSGTVQSFELIGSAVTNHSPVHIELPNNSTTAELVSFGIPTTTGSGWFQVESHPGREFVEQEPNNTPDTATTVEVPGVLNGRFETSGDADHYRFQAKAGQRLHFVAKSREVGSPCDLYMSLHKGADGARLALAQQGQQTVLNFQIPEDGEYLLKVEDLLSGGGPAHLYRIDIQDTFFGFSLHAEQMQYTSPQAGTVVVKVLAGRSGYSGAIELSVTGLGDGVTLEGNRLEGNDTLLKITLPANLPTGAIRLMKIVGSAKIEDKTFTVSASQHTPLATLFPNVLSFPTQLESTVAVGVGPTFPEFFDLAVSSKQLYFPQHVGTSSFDIAINRTNESFKDAVSFSVEGLPEGITAEVAAVEEGKKSYRVTLKGPEDFATGTFPIRIVGTGKFQEQTLKVTLEDLSLRVTKPLVATLEMAGPCIVGREQVAKVQLQRFGADPQPVRLQISDGPAGISSPIYVMIPADASTGEIHINAAANAPTGKFNNLIVVASTTVKGQTTRVKSEPAMIEIQPLPAELNSAEQKTEASAEQKTGASAEKNTEETP
ncbi:MAG: hypothetical protein ABGX16_21810 [Pirellulales bacterium]